MISTDATVLRASDITEHGVHIEVVEEPEWLVNLPELWSEGEQYKPLSKIRIDFPQIKSNVNPNTIFLE